MYKRLFYRLAGLIIVLTLALQGHSSVEAMPRAATGGPKFYAYYYLWWSANHWRDKLGPNYPYSASPLPLPATTDADGCWPTSLYPGNQLVDVPAALFSQDDPGRIEQDIQTAKSAGLSGFWLAWKGNGSASQTLTSVPYTPRFAEALAASNRVGGFKNWVSYESYSVPSADTVINDLNFLYAQFGSDPAWERIDGEPVVTFTGSRKYSETDVARISNAVRGKFYFVGDESRTTLTPSRIALFDGITYYWSSQDPWGNAHSFNQIKEMGDKVHAAGKRWFAPFAPGYNSNLLTGGTGCVPRRNGETMRALWNGNLASLPDGWAMISWNEVAENSHIQPLQKWGNTYINVLSEIIQASDTSFVDVPKTNIFWRYIEALYQSGISSGCSQNPSLFCPNNPVTRGQMAVFIERAMGNSSPNPSPSGMFADVPYPGLESFTPFIEELYNDQITTGCAQSPLRYCPQNYVSRGEMAVFIERALGNRSPNPSPSGMFADVPYPGMEAYTRFIEELYNDGVTGGCSQNPLMYCPQKVVTRAEMAVFIVKAFGIPLP